MNQALELQEKISALLYTFNEVNYALLLELVDGNGWLEDCASEVLLVALFSEQKDNRSRAVELLAKLRQKGYDKCINLLAHFLDHSCYKQTHSSYYSVETHSFNEELQHILSKHAKLFSTKTILIAMALKYQTYTAEALDLAHPDQQHQILEQAIYCHCRLSLDKRQALTRFPKPLVTFEKVAHINLSIKTEYYNPTINYVVPNDQFYLPASLVQLKKLRLLHLHGGPVQNFPFHVFQKLTNLESLSFATCQKVDLEALQKALPNCRLNVRMV